MDDPTSFGALFGLAGLLRLLRRRIGVNVSVRHDGRWDGAKDDNITHELYHGRIHSTALNFRLTDWTSQVNTEREIGGPAEAALLTTTRRAGDTRALAGPLQDFALRQIWTTKDSYGFHGS